MSLAALLSQGSAVLCNDVRAAMDKVSECICAQHIRPCVVSDCLIASFSELREAEVDFARATL